MRFPSRKKEIQVRDRTELMRKRRADAGILRDLSPRTARVTVHLSFLPTATPPHAAQSFTLYPSARAFFEYPCPHGDCLGIYDLDAEAKRALAEDRKRLTGTVECTGTRSRPGLLQQPCGLCVTYSISVERAPK